MGRWVHVAARLDGTNGQVSIFMDGDIVELYGEPEEGSRRPGSREDFSVSFLGCSFFSSMIQQFLFFCFLWLGFLLDCFFFSPWWSKKKGSSSLPVCRVKGGVCDVSFRFASFAFCRSGLGTFCPSLVFLVNLPVIDYSSCFRCLLWFVFSLRHARPFTWDLARLVILLSLSHA